MTWAIYVLVEHKMQNQKIFGDKLQSSVLSFLSLGSAAAQDMNYHCVCLTEFHNRYGALVTVEAKDQLLDSYTKQNLIFVKRVMHVLNERRFGVNVFHFVPLNSKRSTLNFCLKIISSTLYMLHGLHRDWKLSWSHSFTATIVYRPVKSVNPFDFAFLKM